MQWISRSVSLETTDGRQSTIHLDTLIETRRILSFASITSDTFAEQGVPHTRDF